MCAINGITWGDEACVRKMNDLTKHRGPDGTSIYLGEGFTFGHNRLAIIDVTEASSQPMKSADGRYVIVFNGEIYNFKELRAELAPYFIFKTQGDTEVLLAAYSLWGRDMLPKLRGIFAFAIWDQKKEEMILVRDHVGVKPLFWSQTPKGIKFSSELVAFTSGQNTFDRKALSMYLALEYIPSPFTLIDGVNKLQAGHMLHYKNGVSTVTDYAGMSALVSAKGADVYAVIDSAVKQQLVSDRPVGVFLSGGLDSSIVLHHAQKHQNSIRTFSIDFEVNTQGNEGAKFNSDALLASRTAKHYGVEHTICTIRTADVEERLLSMYESLDEPIADSSGFPRYMLSEFVQKEGIVVALGGDGGDELFGGYNRHRALMSAYYFQSLPRGVQDLVAKASPKAQKLIKEFPVPIHLAYMAPGIEDSEYFKGGAIDVSSLHEFFASYYDDRIQSMHPVDAFMRVDRQTWMADLTLALSDRFSMAHGVEFRVPLLSTDVVEASDGVSVYKKTSPFKGKILLRDIYKAHLPSHLFAQPKRGWIAPEAKWLRYEGIKHVVREILSSSYYDGLDDVVHWDKIQSALNDHLSASKYHRRLLWNVIILQIWARKNRVRL